MNPPEHNVPLQLFLYYYCDPIYVLQRFHNDTPFRQRFYARAHAVHHLHPLCRLKLLKRQQHDFCICSVAISCLRLWKLVRAFYVDLGSRLQQPLLPCFLPVFFVLFGFFRRLPLFRRSALFIFLTLFPGECRRLSILYAALLYRKST